MPKLLHSYPCYSGAMKFSADQHLAIAQHLRIVALGLACDDPKRRAFRARARSFLQRGKIARDEDWPSCPVAAACALTSEESNLFAGAAHTIWQRVYAPNLTTTELTVLRREAREIAEFARRLFG